MILNKLIIEEINNYVCNIICESQESQYKKIKTEKQNNIILEYAGYVSIFENFINYALPILIKDYKNGKNEHYFSNKIIKNCGINNRIQAIEIKFDRNKDSSGYVSIMPNDIFTLRKKSKYENLSSKVPLFKYTIHLCDSSMKPNPFSNEYEQLKITLTHELTHLYETTLKYKNLDINGLEDAEDKGYRFLIKYNTRVSHGKYGGTNEYYNKIRTIAELITYYLSYTELNAYLSESYVEIRNIINNNMKEFLDYDGNYIIPIENNEYLYKTDENGKIIFDPTIHKKISLKQYLESSETYNEIKYSTNIYLTAIKPLNDAINWIKNDNEFQKYLIHFIVKHKIMRIIFKKIINSPFEKQVNYVLNYLYKGKKYIENKLYRIYSICVRDVLNKEIDNEAKRNAINNFNKTLSKKQYKK